MSIKENLLAVLKFEDNLNDSCGTNNNFSSEASLTYETGKFGKALVTSNLSGNDIPHITGLLDNLKNNFSVNVWLKATTVAGSFVQKIFEISPISFPRTVLVTGTASPSDLAVYTQIAGQSKYIASAKRPDMDTGWHMYTVSYDSVNNQLKQWIDGGTADIQAVNVPSNMTQDRVEVGDLLSDTTGGNILIDELWLWNKVLTDVDVAELWNNGDGYSYNRLNCSPIYWLITGRIAAEINLRVQQDASSNE